jgi:hypothetical protein
MKALYNTQTNAILPWPRIDEEPVVGLDAHLLEMDVAQEDKPEYDPATQRLEKTEAIDTDSRTVARGWNVVEVPAPVYTAEEHLASVGLAGDRQPTLLYLRLNLQSAGKTSPELDQLEAYLSGILSIFATDPSPRNDWPQPPITFEAAVQSAMQTLLVTPEQSVGGTP